MGNKNNLLEEMLNLAGIDEAEEQGKKDNKMSAQEAGTTQIIWDMFPNSIKETYYYYRQQIPREERAQHGIFEFLDDVCKYLMELPGAGKSPQEVGRKIARFDVKAKEE
jgi:hypothetical protein